MNIEEKINRKERGAKEKVLKKTILFFFKNSLRLIDFYLLTIFRWISYAGELKGFTSLNASTANTTM